MKRRAADRRLFGDGRSGYARVANDWYVEPPEAVAALFAVERFEGHILDPCCGIGTIPRVARAHGYRAAGSDLVDRGGRMAPGTRGGVDFLATRRRPVENIVSNPPYRNAEAFVLRALELARRKVAMLLRLAFLEGQERWRRIYQRLPPARVWVFRERVAMPPGELLDRIEREGGKIAYAWFVWERGFAGTPRLGWI